jgi:hypothetical protein
LAFLVALGLVVGLLFVRSPSMSAAPDATVAFDESGLVGWCKLDDGTGTVAVDSSGNGNDGEFVGEPAPVWRSSEDQVVALEFRGGEGGGGDAGHPGTGDVG